MQKPGFSAGALYLCSSTSKRETLFAIQNRVFASLADRLTLTTKGSEAKNRNMVVSIFNNYSRREYTCGIDIRMVPHASNSQKETTSRQSNPSEYTGTPPRRHVGNPFGARSFNVHGPRARGFMPVQAHLHNELVSPAPSPALPNALENP